MYKSIPDGKLYWKQNPITKSKHSKGYIDIGSKRYEIEVFNTSYSKKHDCDFVINIIKKDEQLRMA